jgi:hypothetical protein
MAVARMRWLRANSGRPRACSPASVAAGVASLGSVFPGVARYPVLTSLVGLTALPLINLIGGAESAGVFVLPAIFYAVSIFAVIVVGLVRGHPLQTIGRGADEDHVPEAIGIVLILKAFARRVLRAHRSCCNSERGALLPAPAVRRAQRTELCSGFCSARC